MASKTFNRRPYTVNTPSSSDIKNYFLNQANWKGLIQNKNFLAVDQESFEDCNNVYVDNTNILKSRPSVKRKAVVADVIANLNLEDVHHYGDLILYYSDKTLYITINGLFSSSIAVGSEYKIVQVKDKLLVFSTNGLFGIDKDGNQYEPEVYVPKTKLVSLDGDEQDLESKNIFTDDEITVYLYTSDNLDVRTTLLGKRVKVEIDGETFEFTFDKYVNYRLFTDLVRIPKDIALTKRIKLSDTEVHELSYVPFTISSKNTYAYFDINTRGVYYSVDGKVFRNVLTISESQLFDETYCNNVEIRFCRENPAILTFMLKDQNAIGTGLYFFSVEPDTIDGSLRYPTLTKIYTLSNNKNVLSNYDALDYNHYAYSAFTDVILYKLFVIRPNTDTVTKTIASGTFTYLAISSIVLTQDYLHFASVYVTDTSSGKEIVKCELATDVYNRFAVTNLFYDFSLTGNNGYAYALIPSYGGRYELITISDTFESTTYPQKLYVKDGILYRSNQIYQASTDENIGNIINANTGTHGNYYLNNAQNKSDYVFVCAMYNDYAVVRSTNVQEVLELQVLNKGNESYNNIVPSHIAELNNFYFSEGSNLYISQKTENDEVYFPEINKQMFTSKITNLHPLSESEMGIFLEDEIWYSYLTENGYAYTKSRLDFGCKDGSDVETSFDGKYTLFDTERGFAALAYQDFVASTEQSVTFVSENIKALYDEFRVKPVKLVKFKDYLFLYNDSILVFDFRTGSWWPWTISNLNRIIRDDELMLIKEGKLCRFDFTSAKYFDMCTTKEDIDWHITSQKLHLNANNNYKHIVNMTFSAVENEDTNTSLSINLTVKNYRHFVDEGKEEVFDYRVQLIRTFVKRLNYAKVREFQYTLRMDDENAIKLPLSLSAISIKYKIGGQVR